MADPGFHRGGGAKSPGKRQDTIFTKILKMFMLWKKSGPLGGASPLCLLRSATEYVISATIDTQ